MPKKKQNKKNTNSYTEMKVVKPTRVPIIPIILGSLIGGFLGGFAYSYILPPSIPPQQITQEPVTPQPIAQEVTPSPLPTIKAKVNTELLNQSTVLIYKNSKNTEASTIKLKNPKDFIGRGTILTSDGWIAILGDFSTITPSNNYKVINSQNQEFSIREKPIYNPNINISFFKINTQNLNVQPFKDYLSLAELDSVYTLLEHNEIFENQISHTHAIIPNKNDALIFSSDSFYQTIKTQFDFPSDAIGSPVFTQNGDIIGIINTKNTITPFNFIQPSLKFVFQDKKIKTQTLGITHLIDLSITPIEQNDKTINKGVMIYQPTANITPIEKGSVAEKAELQANDIITKIDNDEISGIKTLPLLLSEYSTNSTITLTIIRDGLEKKVEVTL